MFICVKSVQNRGRKWARWGDLQTARCTGRHFNGESTRFPRMFSRNNQMPAETLLLVKTRTIALGKTSRQPEVLAGGGGGDAVAGEHPRMGPSLRIPSGRRIASSRTLKESARRKRNRSDCVRRTSPPPSPAEYCSSDIDRLKSGADGSEKNEGDRGKQKRLTGGGRGRGGGRVELTGRRGGHRPWLCVLPLLAFHSPPPPRSALGQSSAGTRGCLKWDHRIKDRGLCTSAKLCAAPLSLSLSLSPLAPTGSSPPAMRSSDRHRAEKQRRGVSAAAGEDERADTLRE